MDFYLRDMQEITQSKNPIQLIFEQSMRKFVQCKRAFYQIYEYDKVGSIVNEYKKHKMC